MSNFGGAIKIVNERIQYPTQSLTMTSMTMGKQCDQANKRSEYAESVAFEISNMAESSGSEVLNLKALVNAINIILSAV